MKLIPLLFLFILPLTFLGCGDTKNGAPSMEKLFMKLTESLSEKDYRKFRSCWEAHDETDFARLKKVVEEDPQNKGKDIDLRAAFEKELFGHVKVNFDQIYYDLGNDLSDLTFIDYSPKDIDLTKEPSVMSSVSELAYAHRSGRVTINLELKGKKINAYTTEVFYDKGLYFLTDTVLVQFQQDNQ